LKGCGTL